MKFILILLLLAACVRAPEPRFKEGDVVEFKGLPIRGLVRDVSSGYENSYQIRLPSGEITRAREVELEPAR